MTMLLPEDDALRKLATRLLSREWWIIITVDQPGTNLLVKFEESFYSGKKNKDFELLVVRMPEALAGIAIALKRHCSPEKMATFLSKERTVPTPVDEFLYEKDVLCWGGDIGRGHYAVQYIQTRCNDLGITTD